MTMVWAGLSTGAIYVLVAVSFNLVFVVSGTFNFAQPQYLMLGTFVSYAVVVKLELPLVVAIAAGAAIGYLIGAAEELIAIRPLSKAGQHAELVTTVGWSVIMEGAALLIWDSDPLKVPGTAADNSVELLGGRLTVLDLIIVVLAVAAAVVAQVLLRRTRIGLAALAVAEDSAAAALRGINIKRMSTVMAGLAGGLLGAMGPVVAPKTFAVFSLGSFLVLKAFVALTIGGFGSNAGALIGGVAVGLIESATLRYLGGTYANLMLFAVLLVVLLVRPQGLFGRQRERVV